MAKFLSHLLAILLSTSCLFANTDTINQVTGSKLGNRLKATNQVTGALSREQVAGYRVQDKNRLKATNQVTGCRLQVAGSKTAELPSEVQIGQEGEIITNCELLTINCGNQDSNLDCYMMMDPEEISEVVDILEPIFKVAVDGDETIRSNPGVTKPFAAEGDCENRFSGFSERKIACTVEENRARVTGQTEEANQASREKCGEENKTHVLVGENEKTSWTWASSCSVSSLYYYVKAIEAQKAGKTALAVGYQEAVLTHERAAAQFKRAVDAYTTGKESEGKSLDLEGNSLQKKADYQVKAIEAEEAGKTIIAAGCREAAVTSEYAVDQFEQSAKAYTTENKSEGDSLYLVGEYFLLRARHQMLSARAEEREKTRLKKGIINRSSDNRIALDPTKADGDLNQELIINKRGMNNSLANKALFICCEKWLAETRLATAPARILSDYVLDVIKRGADQSFVIDFEKYWSYAAKAHQLGDDPQALAWIQVAEDMQRAIKDNILRKTAQASDDWELSTILKYTALATRDMARYRGAYLQAIVDLQSPEIVNWRKKVLEQSEAIVACYKKAVEAVSSKNEQEYKCCGRIARSIKESTSSLGQAVFVFEESLAVSAEFDILMIWRKAAEQYQLSVELDIKAAEEEIKGNTEEAVRLQEVARISREAAKKLENEITFPKKVYSIIY